MFSDSCDDNIGDYSDNDVSNNGDNVDEDQHESMVMMMMTILLINNPMLSLHCLQFLLRNRACSTSLPVPALEGFCNTSEMRLKVLQAHLESINEKGNFW